MSENDTQRASFLVRVWQEKGHTSKNIWVQHIPSGESDFPKDFEELRAFFERWMDCHLDDSTRKGLR